MHSMTSILLFEAISLNQSGLYIKTKKGEMNRKHAQIMKPETKQTLNH